MQGLAKASKKPSAQETMENNEKNNAQNNRTVRNQSRFGRHAEDPKQNRPPPRGAGRGFPSLEFQP